MKDNRSGSVGSAPGPTVDPLVNALERLGHGSAFLWLIFLLTITPTVFNGMHSVIYVFTAEIPKHWCMVPTLRNANWTDAEIRDISSVSPCTKYAYDYTLLASMGYAKAKEYVKTLPPPPVIPCEKRAFGNDTHSSSIVEEWDLVCEELPFRSSTQMAISLGKLVGGGFFGFFSDKYGRRTSYRIGIVLMMITGPSSAFVPWYWGFMLLRFLNGVAHAAITYSSFTILCEVAAEKPRQWMGIAYNTGYASGVVIIPIIGWLLTNWKYIYLAASVPSLLCVFHLWYMPESPRWLLTKGRRKEARDLMEKALRGTSHPLILPDAVVESLPPVPTVVDDNGPTGGKMGKQVKQPFVLISNSEMRRRLCITNFAWLAASLSYYALALNADNLHADRFIYMMIMGISDIPAYILPSAILMLFGRRQSSSVLYTIAGIFLLSILAVPTRYTLDIAGIALLARFIMSAAYGVVILYTSELFPTVARNSAVGSNSTMSHVGSVVAPYLTDLLGAVIWWGPTTVCGCLAIIGGVLISLLPETRGRPMVNTVEEEVDGERETVSIGNLFKC